MAYDSQRKYSVEVSSGATLSTAVDLGKPFNNIYIGFSGVASGSVGLYAAEAADGTYRPVYYDGGTQYLLASGVTAAMAKAPGGLQFIKVYNTSGVTDTAITYDIVCHE